MEKFKKVEDATMNAFIDSWKVNLEHNSKHFSSKNVVSTLIRKSKFKDIPCVIVLAGSSAYKDLSVIYALKNKCLLLCCDVIAKILIDNKIVPNIIVNLDTQEAAFISLFDACNSLGTRNNTLLVVPTTCNKNIITKCNFNIVFYNKYVTHIKFFNDILQKYGYIGSLMVGFTVSTVCLSLAILLGCNPILFIGNDLSFDKLDVNFYSYCDGIIKYKDKFTTNNFIVTKEWYKLMYNIFSNHNVYTTSYSSLVDSDIFTVISLNNFIDKCCKTDYNISWLINKSL